MSHSEPRDLPALLYDIQGKETPLSSHPMRTRSEDKFLHGLMDSVPVGGAWVRVSQTGDDGVARCRGIMDVSRLHALFEEQGCRTHRCEYSGVS